MRTIPRRQSAQAAELMFGDYRRRILALLLSQPEQAYHVREIGRLTGVSPGSLHRELKLLAEAGLLERQRVGNQVRYRAHRDSPIFDELRGIFRKTAGLADVIRDALAGLGSKVRLAFVFGSVAQRTERATSDVDLFVVGSVPFAKVVEVLAPASAQLRREINPVVMPLRDFAAKLAARDRFITRALRGSKIFVAGDARELARLAATRTT